MMFVYQLRDIQIFVQERRCLKTNVRQMEIEKRTNVQQDFKNLISAFLGI